MKCPYCGEEQSNADMLGHIWECSNPEKQQKDEIYESFMELLRYENRGTSFPS